MNSFKKGHIPWNKGKKLHYPVWNKGKFKTLTFTCLNCKETITVQEYDERKYCSQRCSREHQKEVNHPAYKLESRIKKICINCGKEFIILRKVLNRGKERGKFCSNLCVGKYHTGERNGAWQGGIGRDGYPFDFNKELKKLIRKRDNYKCQLCGAPQEEFTKKLCVHHIDYNKDNLNPNNLITLCVGCNGKVNGKRDCWETHFKNVILK